MWFRCPRQRVSFVSSFKIDEDVSDDVADELRIVGFDTKSVVTQGWQGRQDAELWPDLQAEGRALVTGDKGFSRFATQPPHHGVVLLRPERESRQAYVRLIRLAIG